MQESISGSINCAPSLCHVFRNQRSAINHTVPYVCENHRAPNWICVLSLFTNRMQHEWADDEAAALSLCSSLTHKHSAELLEAFSPSFSLYCSVDWCWIYVITWPSIGGIRNRIEITWMAERNSRVETKLSFSDYIGNSIHCSTIAACLCAVHEKWKIAECWCYYRFYVLNTLPSGCGALEICTRLWNTQTQ